MKKQGSAKILIILLIILIAGIAYYFLTPKQTRLGDDYKPDNIQVQDEEKPLFEDNSDKKIDELKIYYYKSDDVSCENLIAVIPEKFDDRYRYKEINALTTLLSGKVPEGYKSAIIQGTILNQLRISKGVAYVDVSQFLMLGSGKCSKDARIAQISKTLKQFDSFETLEFLIDGKPIE